MKRYLQTLAFFVVAMVVLPMILSSAMNRTEPSVSDLTSNIESEQSKNEISKQTESDLSEESKAPQADIDITVLNTKAGKTETIDLEALVSRVLYAEMPASFEIEALKAQAVAIRSYIMYAVKHPRNDGVHDGADICTDYTHCVAYRTYEDAVEAYGVITADDTYCVMLDAAEQTKGMYVCYNGEPINAVFHGASFGRTESCANVWGGDVPYLVSVITPEDKDEFAEKKTFLPSEFKILFEVADIGIEFGEIPRVWVGDMKKDESGRVDSIEICGTIVKGTAVRSALGLRSTNFTIEFVNGYFAVNTVGYGHGVGLSQYGANVLAKQGKAYDEILTHYYVGTTVELGISN